MKYSPSWLIVMHVDLETDERPVIRDAVDDHIYFSKEGSTGGSDVGGGGCGCN